jgi:hypothetical protein
MSKSPTTNWLQLELHVPDFGPVKDYYGKLGFEIVWERNPEDDKGYLVMKMDGTIICFWSGTDAIYNQTYFKRFPKNTPRGYGVELVIMVEHVDSFYEKVKAIANVTEPLVLRPWGSKDFRTADPFGYYLRFTSKHNILDNSNAVE